MSEKQTGIYLQVGFAVGGNFVRVIARIMKIITGHKIKTSVQSCKITIQRCYSADSKSKKKYVYSKISLLNTKKLSNSNIPTQTRYLTTCL